MNALRYLLLCWVAIILVGCRSQNDADASTEFKAIQKKLSQVNSFSVVCKRTDIDGVLLTTSTFAYLKPGFVHLDSPSEAIWCGDKRVYIVNKNDDSYSIGSVDRLKEAAIRFMWGFESITKPKLTANLAEVTFSQYNSIPAVRARYVFHENETKDTLDVYYSRESQRPIAFINSVESVNKSVQGSCTEYEDVKLDPPLTADDFVFKPDRNLVFNDLISNQLKLLQVGSICPDFKAIRIDSKAIRLSDVLKTSKATLLFFWSHG
jgi:outer membrane lipoprotein-sorting protein